MDGPYIRAALFQSFWQAASAGGTAQIRNGVDENNVPIAIYQATDATGAIVKWPGVMGLDRVLKRPIYHQCLVEIANHFTATPDQKLFYTILGSSGIGKTEMIGFLLAYLAPLNLSVRIHYSKNDNDITHPDIWLWNDGQPQIARSNTAPNGFPGQPYCFISDTYPVLNEEVCSRLHVHIVSMAQTSTTLYEEFVDNTDDVQVTKVFPPFTSQEHLWCQGNWQPIAAALAAHNQDLANAIAEVNNAHPASTHTNARNRTIENNRINARKTAAQIKVNGEFTAKWNATRTACTAAGGDPTVGVWTNWEELQIHYDVFGGCMGTLTMPMPTEHQPDVLKHYKALLEDFFSDVVTSSGRLLTEEYGDELEACSFTLIVLTEQIRTTGVSDVRDLTLVKARLRSMFQVTMPLNLPGPPQAVQSVESSKFMSFFLADVYTSENNHFKKMLMGEIGPSGMGVVFEKAAHTVIIKKLRSPGGLSIQHLRKTKRGQTTTLNVAVGHRVFIRKWEDITALAVGEYGIPVHFSFGLIDSVVKVGRDQVYCFQMTTAKGSHKSRAIDREMELHAHMLPAIGAAGAGGGAATAGPPQGANIAANMVYVLDTDNYKGYFADGELPASRWTQFRARGN